ncbi:MAG: hypothetical protein K2X03_31165 [Bryobacteraceae bacterium]|nr:hypothetical protein [Bryobacteraceae bacterium]
MHRHIFGFTFTLVSLVTGRAQTGSDASLTAASAQGTALRVEVPQSVSENVSLQAVLLPNAITKELFGKHIAENYVTVFVNVGNRSRSAALVMQGLYIDYRNWALSGASRKAVTGVDRESYSSSTAAGEVASVEYRIVRGQLQERQPKTGRNWVVRGLQFTGSIAAAYSFPGGEGAVNIIKGISAFNGIAVPGLEKLWPDSLISKLNRISDFGYRTNRVVPRESSEVILAFFPIDRFLTPGLKKIFVATPAVFFNPGLAIADDSVPRDLQKILENISKKSMAELREQVPEMLACHEDRVKNRSACENSMLLRRVVAATSLNSVKIVIDGSMVIDLAAVPAILESVTFDTGTDAATYWNAPGANKKGVIKGRFLSGGVPKIAEAESLGISDLAVDTKLSNDEQLGFTMKFDQPIPNGTNLTIRVVKEGKDGRTTESSPKPETVRFEAKDPVISTATVDSSQILTLTGRNLVSPNLALVVNRTHPTATTFVTSLPASSSATEITLDLKPLNVGKGCFAPTLFLSGTPKAGPPFSIAPSPKLTSPPVKTGKSVRLTGTDLFDLPACAMGLTMKVIEDKVGATPQSVSQPKFETTGKEATFEFDFPATGTFKVRLYQGSAAEHVAEIPVP